MHEEIDFCPACRSKDIVTFCERCGAWHFIQSLADYAWDILRYRCNNCQSEFFMEAR